uniref:Uncharacterized protein n=1 Tax=Bionectria ochroleuca TaxID=29856 RepID=A0A8H7NQV1_BIOOC
MDASLLIVAGGLPVIYQSSSLFIFIIISRDQSHIVTTTKPPWGSRSNSVADAAGAKAPKEGRTLNLVPCEKECRRCLTALADWDGSGLIPTCCKDTNCMFCCKDTNCMFCCKDTNSRSGKCVRCAAHGKQCSPVAAAHRGTVAALVTEASKEVIEPAKLKTLQMKAHRALEAMKKKTGAAAVSAAQRLAVREQEARLARERFHD